MISSQNKAIPLYFLFTVNVHIARAFDLNKSAIVKEHLLVIFSTLVLLCFYWCTLKVMVKTCIFYLTPREFLDVCFNCYE